MAKLVKSKNGASNTKTKSTKTKINKKSAQKVVDLDDKSDHEDDEDFEVNDNENGNTNGNQNNENKSTLLDDCKKAFGTFNLYEVLNLDKTTANSTDIKKAYYKLSLVCHPDKINDESKKEESKFKFQVLGKIYSILSDEEKKKLYDDTGVIDGEDELFNEKKDWDQYFRTMFKKITKDDIDKFFEKYQNSEEERSDLARIYEECKGNFDMILEYMYSKDANEDEPRFKQILNEMIKNEQIKKYDVFVNENKKKANRRKAAFEKEAVEAEKIRKEMGIDESQDSLRNTILARRQAATESFLDKLEAKYANEKTSGKKAKNNVKNNRGKKNDPSDQENQTASDEEMVDTSEEENDEDEIVKPKNKKISRVVKAAGSNSKGKATTGKAKVKRL